MKKMIIIIYLIALFFSFQAIGVGAIQKELFSQKNITKEKFKSWKQAFPKSAGQAFLAKILL